MRIVGLLQVRNEMVTGHLQRFLALNMPLLDKLYAFDDSSTDETPDVLLAAGAVLVGSATREFGNELVVKNKMLDLISAEEDDSTWVFRLDADEICYADDRQLRELCGQAERNGFDSISLGHLNLWKSASRARVDDNYNSFRPVRLWKSSEKVRFPKRRGLHVTSDPLGLSATLFTEKYPIFHYGFYSSGLITQKVKQYWDFGQRGYPLNRLLIDANCVTLEVSEIYQELGSRWLEGQIEDPEPAGGQLDMLLNFNKALLQRQNQTARVTLICLIFAGLEWLEFQYAELLQLSREFAEGEVEILFVANDPSAEVKDFLAANLIPHVVFRGRVTPDEWYINSVYRAYNFGVQSASGEYVLLVNSDMAYSKDFLSNMLKDAADDRFLVSTLIESGRLESGMHAVEKDLGGTPSRFRRREFDRLCSRMLSEERVAGGLFMPLLVKRSRFLELGGFPEGNLTPGSLETYLAGGEPRFATRGQPSTPGDLAFFKLAAAVGVEHMTTRRAIAYHFQEGELRTSRRSERKRIASGIWICNDSIVGVNGETVFWGSLVEMISQLGAKVLAVESGRPATNFQNLVQPLRLFLEANNQKRFGRPRVVFQNATYSLPVLAGKRMVALLQDKPTSSLLKFLQARVVSRSSLIVTNDLETFVDMRGRKSRWLQIPIPLHSMVARQLQIPKSQKIKGERTKAIFVGAFNSVKGWERVRRLIEECVETDWTLVSKYANDIADLPRDLACRVTVMRSLNQDSLFAIVSSHDVLVAASPRETQHLASLEALALGVPILTSPTGYLGGFGEGEHAFGIVSSEFTEGILKRAASIKVEPKTLIQDLGLDESQLWHLWEQLMREELAKSFTPVGDPGSVSRLMRRIFSAGLDISRRYTRWAKYKLMSIIRGVAGKGEA